MTNFELRDLKIALTDKTQREWFLKIYNYDDIWELVENLYEELDAIEGLW